MQGLKEHASVQFDGNPNQWSKPAIVVSEECVYSRFSHNLYHTIPYAYFPPFICWFADSRVKPLLKVAGCLIWDLTWSVSQSFFSDCTVPLHRHPWDQQGTKLWERKITQVWVLYFEASKNLHLLMLTICRSFHLFSHHIICQKFAIPSLSHRCCCNLQGRRFKPCCISMKWVCVVALSRVPPCALSRQG